LNQVDFTTGGTYLSSEVANFKLWYSISDDISGASQIGTDITAALGTGSHSFTGLTQALSKGATAYLWITTDVNIGAVAGHKINVAALTTADLTLSSGSKFGSTYTGGDQTFDATLPVELSSFTTLVTSQYFVELHWTTQSETGVSGYYIYRNASNDIGSAQIVSPLISATNTSSEANYTYVDTEVLPGTWYYWLQNMDMDGSFSYHGPVTASVTGGNDGPVTPDIPLVTSLQNIYPNPFNPVTTITYGLEHSGKVTVEIYNILGQKMRTLVSDTKAAGNYRVRWNGLDDKGRAVTSGIYYVKMTSGNYSQMKKVVLMK